MRQRRRIGTTTGAATVDSAADGGQHPFGQGRRRLHGRTQPGQAVDHVGQVAHLGPARRAVGDVDQHVGPHGAVERAEGQLGRQVAHIGALDRHGSSPSMSLASCR